jgi:hypothetical protein
MVPSAFLLKAIPQMRVSSSYILLSWNVTQAIQAATVMAAMILSGFKHFPFIGQLHDSPHHYTSRTTASVSARL